MTAVADAPAAVAKLPLAACEQMTRAFPLGNDAKIVKLFPPVPDANAAYPHSVMTDGKQQIFVMAGKYPYILAGDDTRRRAGSAVRETEYASRSLSAIGGVFALLNDQVVKDPAILSNRQDDCIFGRAFSLAQTAF
jgi:hypothetical protein